MYIEVDDHFFEAKYVVFSDIHYETGEFDYHTMTRTRKLTLLYHKYSEQLIFSSRRITNVEPT